MRRENFSFLEFLFWNVITFSVMLRTKRSWHFYDSWRVFKMCLFIGVIALAFDRNTRRTDFYFQSSRTHNSLKFGNKFICFPSENQQIWTDSRFGHFLLFSRHSQTFAMASPISINHKSSALCSDHTAWSDTIAQNLSWEKFRQSWSHRRRWVYWNQDYLFQF